MTTGRLVKLELENFKSYHGRQIIGPFEENFVAVIGPNGAGKSNLMDALSFVLGIHSGHLRSTNLTDLIYRRSSEDGDGDGEGAGENFENGSRGPKGGKGRSSGRRKDGNANFAKVAAHYCKADGTELVFTRSISANAASEYRLNGRVIPYAEYVQVWEGENVLIKARNFLVFQGDVEAIASKSPRELARLFEQISDSEEFREEYDRCKAALEHTLEESALNFNKKRGMGAELKLVQEQREDVARFEKLMDAKNALKCEYYLWKLFHVEESARKIGAAIEEKERELGGVEGDIKKHEAAWRAVKREQAKRQKELLAAERKAKIAQVELDSEAPKAVKIEERVRFNQHRLAAVNETYQNTVRDIEGKRAEIAMVEGRIAKVQESIALFEEMARHQLEAAQISPELLSRYNELKTVVSQRVAKERLKLESLERKLAPEAALKAQLTDKLAEFESSKLRVDDEKGTLALQQQQLAGDIERLDAEVDRIQRELAGSQARRLKLEQTEAEVTERLREVMSRLLEAKVDRQEGEREIKLRFTLESLKKIFPGVHGRVLDLCRPSNRKYEQAVAVALGRNIDAIVVDQEKTAVACIQYLREQKAGQATFIPLDTIQARPDYERYRGLVESARPALDVVKFEEIYAKAFYYACRGAMVCDSIQVAKHICYERDIRVKAITLDGTVIHKSGLITGGVHGQPSRRWEEREVQSLKNDRDQCLATLSEISKSLRRTDADERLRAQLIELEARRAYLADELATHQRKLAGVQEEAMHIDQERHRCQGQLEKVVQALSKHDREISTWTEIIHGAEDEVFAEFCHKAGLANVREFEASRMSVSRDVSERRMQFCSVLSKLQQQGAFLKQEIEESSGREGELQDKLRELREEATSHDAEEKELLAGVEEKRAALARAQAEAGAKKREWAEGEGGAEAARRLMSEAQGTAMGLSREITANECEIDRLLSSRQVILRTCRIEQVELPLQKGALGSFLESDVAGAERDGPQMFFNFAGLSRQAKGSGDAAMEQKYMEAIRETEEEMEKLAPNLRSLDKIGGAESRLRTTMEQFERCKGELKKAKDEFAAVRAKRYQRFNQAFKHISSKIDAIFKELTRSETVPMGGTAFLSVENPEEPYLEGVRYHAMPPMKRFLDMDQLSGGEKTIAALALLFAIHTYRPAPFFILDEIDAALDSGNVQRISRFIHARSQGVALQAGPGAANTSSQLTGTESSQDSPRETHPTPVQFVVISLKSSLYEKADALVGIYRDPDERSSRVLTLRLAEYPE